MSTARLAIIKAGEGEVSAGRKMLCSVVLTLITYSDMGLYLPILPPRSLCIHSSGWRTAKGAGWVSCAGWFYKGRQETALRRVRFAFPHLQPCGLLFRPL